MSIRLRVVEGRLLALCAARSIEKLGDRYLDDSEHYALAQKAARDNDLNYAEAETTRLVEIEESNNPNRDDWDRVYGKAIS